jgi:hypothetical protein
MPVNFLLHIGVAMRLCAWEAQGFSFHRDAGLPAAKEALRHALCSPDADPSDLGQRVTCVSLENIAWCGLTQLRAEIALDTIDDESAFDALAEFLWSSRNNGRSSTDHPT